MNNDELFKLKIFLSQYSGILLVLITHYVADFVLQTRWMGENKSKNMTAMLAHIFVYTAAISIFGIKFAVINGILHLITDLISSKLSGRAYVNKNMGQFWDVIGMDQLIHTLTLILTYVAFGN